MTLVDTGPLVALLNRSDPNHRRCIAIAGQLPVGPLISTWPCFTEAMHFLQRAGGVPAQQTLWRMYLGGKLQLRDVTSEMAQRMSDLMAKYHDLPMDLADSSLTALAEDLGTNRIFTLDQDFRIYRLKDGTSFEVLD